MKASPLASLRFRSSHESAPQGLANFGLGTLAAKPCCQQIKLRRIRSARRWLHVPHMGEIALERREQRRLGAPLQHLAEKRAARGDRFAPEIGRGFREGHELY